VDACYSLKGAASSFRSAYKQSGRRVIEAIDTHLEVIKQNGQEIKFDYLAAAIYLAEHVGADRTLPGFELALDRMEALFKDLNRFL